MIAGTGSIAFGRNAAGLTARAGGWGYVFGDEGGGFDIVRQALRAALRLEEGWGRATSLRATLLGASGARDANDLLHRFYTPEFPRPRIAAMAKLVDQAAGEGDPAAREILMRSGQALAQLAAAVRPQLFQPAEPARISYLGGVFRSPVVRERFFELLAGRPRQPCRAASLWSRRGRVARGLSCRGSFLRARGCPRGKVMIGWLPDYIWREGAFESGVAMFADSSGRITHFSSATADLAQAERLQGRAILPGLINAHSHAFQRVIRGRTEQRSGANRDTFWTWREAMYRAANLLSPEAIYHAARMAFLDMLLSGITTAGEFHYLHHDPAGQPYGDRNLLALQILRAAEDTGLRIALLRAAYVRGGQPRFLTPRIEDFIADTEALSGHCKPGRSWVGIAPHSIRAVPLDYLLELVRYARAKALPVHMHVAEQPAEVETCIAEYGMPPVALLHQHDILDDRFTAIHAIHVTEQEIDQLGAARSMVCACPTTERNLGDGTCPADRLTRAGVRIALGSDSNVQIDLLEDARELEYHLRLERLERVVLDPEAARRALAGMCHRERRGQPGSPWRETRSWASGRLLHRGPQRSVHRRRGRRLARQ